MTSEHAHPGSMHLRQREHPVPESKAAQQEAAPQATARDWPWLGAAASKLAQAVVFGFAFGFLLQKGGVAKFDILVGVLLLENFVVVKVMVSAIIVGMVGVHLGERAGRLKFQIKDTVYGTNVIGGLLFGLGFGLIAYCPGTNAAAVGQGNFDALTGIVGMVVGSYLFALVADPVRATIGAWGARGELTLPEVFRLRRGVFVLMAVVTLAGVLLLLELFAGQ